MGNAKPFNILVVEDSEADQNLFAYLFSNSPIHCSLHFASDGEEGGDYAFAKDPYASRPTPDLILMDMNLPRKDGRQLIKEIKADKRVSNIPIIMVSTSCSAREVNEAFCHGASAFVTKPTSVDEFQMIVNGLTNFWLKCSILPTRPEGRTTL